MRNRIEEKIGKFIKETEVGNLVVPELNVDSERKSWLEKGGFKGVEGLPEALTPGAKLVGKQKEFLDQLRKYVSSGKLNPRIATEFTLQISKAKTPKDFDWIQKNINTALGLKEGRGMQAAGIFEADEKVTCPQCNGSKTDEGEPCSVCRGTGKLTRLAWERRYGNPATMHKEAKGDKSIIGKSVSIEMYVDGKFKGHKGKVIKQLSNGKYVVKMENGRTVDREREELELNEATDKTLDAVPIFQTGSDFGTIPSANTTKKFLEQHIKAPVVGVQVSTLGGSKNVSILIVISLQEKKDWANGILENSPYMRLHLYNNGKLEQFSGGVKGSKPMRRVVVKSAAEAVARINKYIELVKSVKKESGPIPTTVSRPAEL